jgi:poly[(R)-3-hydroxyalkanoate] polymerase subunit PhaC
VAAGLMQAAPHRIGHPSPLIFHLGAALSAYAQALLAAPRADSPSFPWAPGLGADASSLANLDQFEIAREIASRLSATIAGLEIWQAHPYRRALADPPAIWQDGCSRLLDYGGAPEATNPGGPPVLFVPSLINRAYILDLAPGRSLLRWLAAQGHRPMLMDWGSPGRAEAGFDLEAYGARRLVPALVRVRELAGGPVPLVGYCMGGTLAVGLAARAPYDISGLVVVGAPWDFASTRGIAGGFRAMIRAEGPARAERLLDSLGEAFGMVPVSLFQMLFALINPLQAALKFQKLARLDPDGPAARLFVALEDWLADGIPMPARAAKDLLVGWQIRNLTATRGWRFLGGSVDPRAIRAPTLVFCGEGDTIAPPALAQSLGRIIPGARMLSPRTGHVGMVVGSAARPEVWRPLAAFLAAIG